jgi:thymidylate synthase ThyX
MFEDDMFIETLLIKAYPDIEDSALDLLIEDVRPVLYDRVMTNLVQKMPEDKLQEFLDITKKDYSDQELQSFLQKTIKDYDGFIDKVYKDFEDMYLEEQKYVD